MAIRSEYIKRDMRLKIHVSCRDLNSEIEIEKTFADLYKALEKIVESLEDKSIYFFSIEIECGSNTMEPETVGYPQAAYPEGEYNPWEAQRLDFWLSAFKAPHLHQRIKDWFVRLEEVLEQIKGYKRSTEGLWEDEYTQFCEPLISYLANCDIEFVPYYTRLLRRWDLMHEVKQLEVIDAIFRKFGACAETEELLYCRVVETEGQHEIDQVEKLFPFLQEEYGDFTKSLLFRRMVARWHAKELELRTETANAWNSAEWFIFKGCSHKELEDGAKRILDDVVGKSK